MSGRGATLVAELLARQERPPERGPMGERGPEGPEGPQGPMGPVGPQGPRGFPGNDGKEGAPGRDGKDGIDGKDGEDGKRGPKGERGAMGPQGPASPGFYYPRGGGSASSGGGAPSGPAGGVLAGTYPDPSFAEDMATQAELDAAIAGIGGANFYVQATDPSLDAGFTGTGSAWVDTTVPGPPWHVQVRNATDDGWNDLLESYVATAGIILRSADDVVDGSTGGQYTGGVAGELNGGYHQFTGGDAPSTNAGATLYIGGGDDDSSTGGPIQAQAGAGGASTSDDGGSVSFQGGNGGSNGGATGGKVFFTGGAADGFAGARLDLNGGALDAPGLISLRTQNTTFSLLSGAADPSAGAGLAAPLLSTYRRNNAGVGELWFKVGSGDTDWSQVI